MDHLHQLTQGSLSGAYQMIKTLILYIVLQKFAFVLLHQNHFQGTTRKASHFYVGDSRQWAVSDEVLRLTFSSI